MYSIFCDPKVMHFGDGVKSREGVQAWLHECLEHYQNWGFGPYAVVEQSSQNVIGYCGLFFFPNIDGRAETEIGYRFAHSAWGQGYATEAVRAVRDHAFQTLRIKRLIALIDPSNFSSIRVAEKIGLKYEKEVMLDGYTHPDHVYVITSMENTFSFSPTSHTPLLNQQDC